MPDLLIENCEIQDMSKTPAFSVSSILIILSSFFAPWGAGLQKIVNFDLSKIFVGIAILTIVYW